MAAVQVSVHLNTALRNDSRTLAVPLNAGDRFDLWRCYTAWLAACAPHKPPPARRIAGVLTAEELRKHLVAITRGGVDAHMLAAHTALGLAHPEHLPHIFAVRSLKLVGAAARIGGDGWEQRLNL